MNIFGPKMKATVSERILQTSATIRAALERINSLSEDLVLFVVDQRARLVGTLTDGDVRRALLNGCELSSSVNLIVHRSFRCLRHGRFRIDDLSQIRSAGIDLVPILDEEDRILAMVNLRTTRSLLPVEAVIMAGGEGRRLRPQTEHTPKPLLPIGGKPIIQYNIEHLVRYGVNNITISIKYLGQQVRNTFGDGTKLGCAIRYVDEKTPLGTIGALSLIEEPQEDTVLVMNSDILTNIDFEDFFIDFENSGASLAVATIPYHISIPYAVLETCAGRVSSLKEKPSYTYFSNAGIYLVRKAVLKRIPRDTRYHATDLIESLLMDGEIVRSYPLRNYWLDIGNPEDFRKATEDIKHIHF